MRRRASLTNAIFGRKIELIVYVEIGFTISVAKILIFIQKFYNFNGMREKAITIFGSVVGVEG